VKLTYYCTLLGDGLSPAWMMREMDDSSSCLSSLSAPTAAMNVPGVREVLIEEWCFSK